MPYVFPFQFLPPHNSSPSFSSLFLSPGLPKTPRTPRSTAKHYFDEHIATPSEYGDGGTPYSAYSEHTLGDISPEDL